jgi:LytS/YehU family sensor histidine kinase
MAYLLSRWRIFSNLIFYRTNPSDRAWILAYFSLFAGLEFLLPAEHAPFVFPSDRALISLSILASTSAGILAGPWIGLGTGLFSLSAGLLTHEPNALATGMSALLGGALGSCIYLYRPHRLIKIGSGFLVSMTAHTLRLGLILLSINASVHWDAQIILYIATVVVNGLATSLFLAVVADIGTQHEKIGRLQVSRALQIANQTLPHLRPGLNEETAGEIVRIILDVADVDAVAVTNTSHILAFAGEGESHHRSGNEICLEATHRAIHLGTTEVAEGKTNVGCSHSDCPLSSAVVAPLCYKEKPIGAVEIYQTEERPMNAETIELAIGFAQFLSRYLMEAEELQRQIKEASEAQLRALQAQVHPHFLFNTLNTLASLCRFDPRHAESLTIQLGAFFRRTLKRNQGSFVTLREELQTVDTYLEIEKARFGESLVIVKEIDSDLMDRQLPTFILQPLVENAVLHGISQKSGGGLLRIVGRKKCGWSKYWVIDDGAGVKGRTPSSLLKYSGVESHGLSMLNERLDNLYKGDYRFRIFSRPGKGTLVFLSIPEKAKIAALENES